MRRFVKRWRGFSLLEVVVGVGMLAVLLAMAVPNTRKGHSSVSSKSAAMELASFLGRAKEASAAKKIPVLIAIPKDATHSYSQQALLLEGEFNPRLLESYRIAEKDCSVVFQVGRWPGISWAVGDTQPLQQLWADQGAGQLSKSNCFLFRAGEDLVSNAPVDSAGNRHIVVASGLKADENRIERANSPWTVHLARDGRVSLESGIPSWSGSSTSETLTPPGALIEASAGSQNHAPQLLGTPTFWPDRLSEAGDKHLVDVAGSLTIEVKVQDQDGDPLFATWRSADPQSGAGDRGAAGGSLSLEGKTRMQWHPPQGATAGYWSSQVSWSPASDDPGGQEYKLVCDVTDSRGEIVPVACPSDSTILSVKKQLLLFISHNPIKNVDQLFTMSVENGQGSDYRCLTAAIPESVRHATWSDDGESILFATASGAWQHSHGQNSPLGSRIDPAGSRRLLSSCQSPFGDDTYLLIQDGTGAHNRLVLRTIHLNGSTVTEDERTFSQDISQDEAGDTLSSAYFSQGGTAERVLVFSGFHKHRSPNSNPFNPIPGFDHAGALLMSFVPGTPPSNYQDCPSYNDINYPLYGFGTYSEDQRHGPYQDGGPSLWWSAQEEKTYALSGDKTDILIHELKWPDLNQPPSTIQSQPVSGHNFASFVAQRSYPHHPSFMLDQAGQPEGVVFSYGDRTSTAPFKGAYHLFRTHQTREISLPANFPGVGIKKPLLSPLRDEVGR